MNKTYIRLAQQELNRLGASLVEDGGYGLLTLAALDSHLTTRDPSEIPAEWTTWSKTRKLTAFIQLLAEDEGVDVGTIDGFWGPHTDFGYGSLRYLREHGVLPPPWRDIPQPPSTNPNGWPSEEDAVLRDFYGPVATHQTRIELPYRHKLAWNKTKKIDSFICHERVHDSMNRVLERVLDHYGLDRVQSLRLDLWGGCFNQRKKRGGSSWSTHAWAIAVDYDPEHNKLHWNRDRARFARPEYDAWWRFWEEEGWVSLGRARNFDWMHIQAARP